ncbi:MAG: hypothetical protein QG670_1430 [Thermoproteota archaeon]|nr:hypothetical protein [Thermoproteota archaeon]
MDIWNLMSWIGFAAFFIGMFVIPIDSARLVVAAVGVVLMLGGYAMKRRNNVKNKVAKA